MYAPALTQYGGVRNDLFRGVTPLCYSVAPIKSQLYYEWAIVEKNNVNLALTGYTRTRMRSACV